MEGWGKLHHGFSVGAMLASAEKKTEVYCDSAYSIGGAWIFSLSGFTKNALLKRC